MKNIRQIVENVYLSIHFCVFVDKLTFIGYNFHENIRKLYAQI